MLKQRLRLATKWPIYPIETLLNGPFGGIVEGFHMNDVSKISSTDHGLERRLPFPFEGVDVNFCRNPQYSGLGLSPYPYKRPLGSPAAPPGSIRDVVAGSRHSEFFTCPTAAPITA